MEKINKKEVDNDKYLGANLYIKEKPTNEFKNIDNSIYVSHHDEDIKKDDIKKDNEVQVINNPDNKTVYLGFPTTKRTIVIFCLFVLVPLTIFFLVIPTVNYNGVPTNMSLLSRIGMLSYFWAFSLAGYYFTLKPFSITFIKNNDGFISVIKQKIFYIKKSYSFIKENNLSIVGKKGRVFNQGFYFVVFFKPKYKMLLRYEIDGIKKEDIDLSFKMFYSDSSVGRDLGFFNKEQLVEISNSLDINLVIE